MFRIYYTTRSCLRINNVSREIALMTDLANDLCLLLHRCVAWFFSVHLIGRIFSYSPSLSPCFPFSLFSRRTICARVSKNNYKSANGEDKNYLHAAAAEMPSARRSLHVLRPPLTSIAFILKTVRAELSVTTAVISNCGCDFTQQYLALFGIAHRRRRWKRHRLSNRLHE